MISLVIPIRDETATLADLIVSIRAQTRQPDEVVLVDGGSTDGTAALVRRLTEGDARFRILEAGPATPGRGRNIGIAAASYDWIALTDAGIRLEPEWLQRLAEAAERNPEAGIVYGNFEPLVRSRFEECETLVFVHPRGPRPGGVMRGPFIASSLVRREAWERAGGFPDLRAAEDLIFMEKLEQAGVRAAWAPDATVWWKLPAGPRALVRRFMLFSKHNVWAGRQRFWHYGVARFYAFCVPFIAAAALLGPAWLVPPILLWLARVARAIHVRGRERGPAWELNPLRFAGTAFVLALVETATLAGWLQAYLEAPPPRPDEEVDGVGNPVEGSQAGVISR